MTTKNFIGPDNKLIVEGIILGGSANFKSDLEKGEILDERIQKAVLSIVDVSYGGENGLNEAIWLASGVLANVKFMNEKKLLSDFYAEIA
jgi:peptide chain release factor subunit 1